MSMRLEAAWFQGVLFSLLYRQCADTIKGKAIIAIKRGNSKTKSSKKRHIPMDHLTSARCKRAMNCPTTNR